jgi:molybdopterin synthase catalytic subunit
MALIRVTAEDFSPALELDRLAVPGAGGVASFIGLVRSDAANPLAALTLEHYAGMTEAAILKIAEQAELRFSLLACSVVHRYGRLTPGARIVFCGAAAPHRQAALDATAFIIDWLKTSAPFWKKEEFFSGESGWVMARAEDDAAASGWG